MDELHKFLGALADDTPGARHYTLHLNYLADDDHQALVRAEQYARALNYVRPEVDCFTAQYSRDRNWDTATDVFCGSPGPYEDDECIDLAGHPGRHHGPGSSGTWYDSDVPHAPDTPEALS